MVDQHGNVLTTTKLIKRNGPKTPKMCIFFFCNGKIEKKSNVYTILFSFDPLFASCMFATYLKTRI